MADAVLITGAAKRIGAACARLLHRQGYTVIVHYHRSDQAALALCRELNALRSGSAHALKADLCNPGDVKNLAEAAAGLGGVKALVNNASAFYPTPFEKVTFEHWNDLFNSNLKAPFFLSQALAGSLTGRQGCIVNIADIHAERGLAGYPVYSLTKAGLAALTRILAKELAPAVRVNAVAPGAILWPEQTPSEQQKQEILARIALQRLGRPADIAKAVLFLIDAADYITGQIISVDGGRLLFS